MSKAVDWTSEMIFEMKRLMALPENYSFHIIADMMSEKFGEKFTRNSVLGKVHRMKLPARETRTFATDENTKRKAPRKPRRPSEMMRSPRPRFRSAPLPELYIVRDNQPSVTELEAGDCRWPEGTGPYTFCGNPASRGAYCAHHASIAYYEPKMRWK